MYSPEFYDLGMTPSVIRTLFNYGIEKSAEVGADKVFDYSLGNPSIPAPASVNEAIKRIVDTVESTQLHGYSMAPGLMSTREAIAKNLKKRFGCDCGGKDIYMTCGAAPALVMAIKALVSTADSEIIALAPYFVEYKCFAEHNGAKLKVVPADTKSFQVNLTALEETITPNTCAVIVNSPNNPSGVVYTEDTIRRIGDILAKKGKEYGHAIYIIADEPYRELVYGGVEVPFVPNLYDNTLVCYSWSKSLSLPGERIGYVYVSPKCEDADRIMTAISAAARVIGHVCPPTLIQRVIEACIDEQPDLDAYDKNRELLYNSLTKMGYKCAKPDGAFYLFVKAPNGDDLAFSERAKLAYNLLAVPGTIFGCPGYLRLSYCVSYDMIQRSLPAFQSLIDELGR